MAVADDSREDDVTGDSIRPSHRDSQQIELLLAEINEQLGTAWRAQRRLSGGSQNGAWLITTDDQQAVLKTHPAETDPGRVSQAYPAINLAADHGWPVARGMAAGHLTHGGAYSLQEYMADGVPATRLDPPTVTAVLAANERQATLGFAATADDTAQLEAVLSGDHEWKAWVSDFTPAGATLVNHGDEIAARADCNQIPSTDVVHGDYSVSNIIIRDDATVTFVDAETVARGSRVRDLADLYRQGFVYPDPAHTGMEHLLNAGQAIAGPRVFAKCAVAVTYNNLAWWVEHKTVEEFDLACSRLHDLFTTISAE